MGVVRYKIFSDLWKNKARTLQVVMIIAMGAFAVGMIIGSSDLIRAGLTRVWLASNPASINLAVDPAVDDETIQSLGSVAGVEAVMGSLTTSIEWRADAAQRPPGVAERLLTPGQFEVGACNYKTYDKMVADGKIDPAVCKVIWKSDLYADYNMTAHPDLEKTFGAGFIDKLQKTLLRLDDPELLAAFQRDRLIAASNEDFSRIEELAVELGLTD